ncbi:DNA-binding protein [Thioalkalivibrio nitratireducens]|uniref:helix-turn-helix domain-containing transcriptional regulator n=1 Tax=Thioalkalivibrio nitratireducens TaxID=186931 RepID=UPI001F203356|nr:hypothetical protein [Thioalkalivibrio nitratireducens]
MIPKIARPACWHCAPLPKPTVGWVAVAAEAGISRESLYRALSPRGNPTLKTLVAVLKTVGMRLSVEPEHRESA